MVRGWSSIIPQDFARAGVKALEGWLDDVPVRLVKNLDAPKGSAKLFEREGEPVGDRARFEPDALARVGIVTSAFRLSSGLPGRTTR